MTDMCPPPRGLKSRPEAISAISRHLLCSGHPRLLMTVLLGLACATGVILAGLVPDGVILKLWQKISAVGVAAYGSFLTFLRCWLAWREGRLEPDSGELPDFWSYTDGSSGIDAGSGTGMLDYLDFAWDDGDAWLLLLWIGVVILTSALAAEMILRAPAFLAEVLLDHHFPSGGSTNDSLMRRWAWLATAVRRTWFQFTTVVVLVACLAGLVEGRLSRKSTGELESPPLKTTPLAQSP